MILCKLLMLFFMFNELFVHLDALTCPRGQKISNDGRHCESCQDGYFQPDINESKLCKLCTTCKRQFRSFVKETCTKEKDTICQCIEGAVPMESDTAICKCDKGYELKNGVCSECKEGYFNPNPGLLCKKWKDCKSAGEKTKGSTTSDVICNEPTALMSTSTTSHITDTSFTHSKSHSPHGGAHTPRMLTAITTTAALRVTSRGKVEPSSPSNNGNPFGVGPLILVIAAILLLAAVTCKLYNTPCKWEKTTAQKKDSCRRPVEESGGSQSFLKMYPEEP